MVMSLMLLEQVALSNSHLSVFNLQELQESEELKTLFRSLFNILLDFFWLGFKIRRECTIH